jgi:hypothetical protein
MVCRKSGKSMDSRVILFVFKYLSVLLKVADVLGSVACTCDHNYVGGWDQEDCGYRPGKKVCVTPSKRKKVGHGWRTPVTPVMVGSLKQEGHGPCHPGQKVKLFSKITRAKKDGGASQEESVCLPSKSWVQTPVTAKTNQTTQQVSNTEFRIFQQENVYMRIYQLFFCFSPLTLLPISQKEKIKNCCNYSKITQYFTYSISKVFM